MFFEENDVSIAGGWGDTSPSSGCYFCFQPHSVWATAGPLAVGWTQTAASSLQISAYLGNGNYAPSSGDAYLTTQIGSGTTAVNEIAQVHFTLPEYPYNTWVSLFTGLTLSQGNYWLTISSPTPPASYVNWDICHPCNVGLGAGSSYLGWGYFSATASFEPGAAFTLSPPIVNGSAYSLEFDVQTPEPSTAVLCCLTLFTVFIRRCASRHVDARSAGPQLCNRRESTATGVSSRAPAQSRKIWD